MNSIQTIQDVLPEGSVEIVPVWQYLLEGETRA